MTTGYKTHGQQPAPSQVVSTAFVSNKALTSNVVTLTTAAANTAAVGSIVIVQGVDSVCDGTYVVSAITSSTVFSYVKVATNIASVAVSPVGVVTIIPVTAGQVVTNKVIQNYVCTLTVASTTGYVRGDYVTVTIGDATIDGQNLQIIGVPSGTTICIATPAMQTLASVAVSAGALAKTSYQADIDTASVGTTGGDITSTLFVCNQSTITQYFRIGIRIAGAAVTNQWSYYDAPLLAGQTLAITAGLALGNTDVLTVRASSNLVTFTDNGAKVA